MSLKISSLWKRRMGDKNENDGPHCADHDGNSDHNAPNCFKNSLELALALAGEFTLNDFLKLTIAFFESPFVYISLTKTVETISTLGKRFVLSVNTSMALSVCPLFIN